MIPIVFALVLLAPLAAPADAAQGYTEILRQIVLEQHGPEAVELIERLDAVELQLPDRELPNTEPGGTHYPLYLGRDVMCFISRDWHPYELIASAKHNEVQFYRSLEPMDNSDARREWLWVKLIGEGKSSFGYGMNQKLIGAFARRIDPDSKDVDLARALFEMFRHDFWASESEQMRSYERATLSTLESAGSNAAAAWTVYYISLKLDKFISDENAALIRPPAGVPLAVRYQFPTGEIFLQCGGSMQIDKDTKLYQHGYSGVIYDAGGEVLSFLSLQLLATPEKARESLMNTLAELRFSDPKELQASLPTGTCTDPN